MTIEILLDKELISVRAHTVCLSYGLLNLEDIRHYFNEKKTFTDLKNCGRKCINELTEVCNYYEPEIAIEELDAKTLFIESPLNVNIKYLLENNKISSRVYNACEDQRFFCINDIIKHYRVNHQFIFKNCGKKTQSEFLSICLEYNDLYKDNLTNQSFSKTGSVELTVSQEKVLETIILSEIKKLPLKARDILNDYLNNDLTLTNIYKNIILIDTFALYDSLKVNNNLKKKLFDFFKKIVLLSQEVSVQKKQKELNALQNRFLLNKYFPSIDNYPSQVISSMFSFVKYLLDEKVIFDSKENFIFENCLRIFIKKDILKIKNAAEILQLAEFKIVQIRTALLQNLQNNFSFLTYFEDEFVINLTSNLDCIFINEEEAENINLINGTQFSKEFILFLLYISTNKKYKIFGNIDEAFKRQQNDKKIFDKSKYFYLIERELYFKINFTKLLKDLSQRTLEKRDKSYILNFKDYVFKFLKTKDEKEIMKIQNVVSVFIRNEFDIEIRHGDIVFKRTTKKTLAERVIEVLERLDKPSTINEINRNLQLYFPDLYKSDVSIKTICQRSVSIISFGRTGLYGLKSWEELISEIGTGTIRSIVFEYLDGFQEPKNISEILHFVSKYRRTTERSILENLKLEKSKSFVFFENNYVGVKNKDYDLTFIILKSVNQIPVKTWDERFKDLQLFLQENNSIPLSSSSNAIELSLYRWLKVQKSKLISGELTFHQSKLLREFILRNKIRGGLGKVQQTTEIKYTALQKFIKTNLRLPKSKNIGESYLYRFLCRQRNLYNNKKLSPQDLQLYIKIIQPFDLI